MRNLVPRPPPPAKNLAAKVAERRARRRLPAPDFIHVDRRFLWQKGMTPLRCAVAACIQYLCKHERPILNVTIAHWLGVDPSTVSRARRDMPKLPLPPYPNKSDPRFGWVQLKPAVARKAGVVEALAEAQIAGWIERDSKLAFVGRYAPLTAQKLANQLGTCVKTARRALTALAGKFLHVVRRAGKAALVRVLSERERPSEKPLDLVPPEDRAVSPPAPPRPPEEALFDDLERLAAALD